MRRLLPREAGLADWTRPGDMPQTLYRLLRARGIQSARAAEAFLHPGPKDLLPPDSLHDMDRTVARLKAALQNRERVCVWGDYDVDGVSATAILEGTLAALGGNVFHHLPSRQTEGYGLNRAGIEEIAKDARLLLTVDCGVTSVELVAYAKELGLDVIVTDHHEPGEALPDCPVVNPLLGGYANPGLCGAGVAFKVALALDEETALSFIDLAALATVADVVPLLGENRALVALGLERINEAPRTGIDALISTAKVNRGALKAGNLAFQLVPRLNAGGRLGSADRALSLLTSTDADEAMALALELESENGERRRAEAEILRDAASMMETFDFVRDRVIVLWGENWNVGVVGLAASRLVEKYALPAIMLSGEGDILTGSCRSVPGVDIHEMLVHCAHLLEKFGGHKQAAGLSLRKENLPAFVCAINDAIRENADAECFVPSLEYDFELPLSDFDEDLCRAMEALEPTGFGNPAPRFLTRGVIAQAKPIGKEGAHLKLWITDDDFSLSGRWWRNGGQAGALQGRTCLLCGAPVIDAYQNRVSVQLDVRAAFEPTGAALCPDEETCAHLAHAFLDAALARDAAPSDGGAPDLSEMTEALRASPYGTCIAVTDANTFRALLDALPGERFDVCVGAWPSDPRPFSALAFLPAGDLPPGCERLFCPDAPAWFFAPGRAGGGHSPWMAELPDKDDLRALYVALRALLRRPFHRGVSVDALCRELSQMCPLSPIGAHAGLCVLDQMRLIDFRSGPPLTLALLPVVKAEPEDFPLFQTICALRREGGAGQ